MEAVMSSAKERGQVKVSEKIDYFKIKLAKS